MYFDDRHTKQKHNRMLWFEKTNTLPHWEIFLEYFYKNKKVSKFIIGNYFL